MAHGCLSRKSYFPFRLLWKLGDEQIGRYLLNVLWLYCQFIGCFVLSFISKDDYKLILSLSDLEITHAVALSTAWLYSWQQQEDAESIYPVERFLCRSTIRVAPCCIWCVGNAVPEEEGAPTESQGLMWEQCVISPGFWPWCKIFCSQEGLWCQCFLGVGILTETIKSIGLFPSFVQGKGECCTRAMSSSPKEPTDAVLLPTSRNRAACSDRQEGQWCWALLQTKPGRMEAPRHTLRLAPNPQEGGGWLCICGGHTSHSGTTTPSAWPSIPAPCWGWWEVVRWQSWAPLVWKHLEKSRVPRRWRFSGKELRYIPKSRFLRWAGERPKPCSGQSAETSAAWMRAKKPRDAKKRDKC